MQHTDISELVAEAAADLPHRQALVEAGGRSLTWSELEDEVARVATGLGEQGVLAGHRVMVATANRLEFVTTYLGVLRAQAVAVPVNPRSGAEELARMVLDSGSRLVVADDSALDAVRRAVSDLPEDAGPPRVVVVGAAPGPDEIDLDALRSGQPSPVPPLPDPDKLAALLYTSGSSGRPRAAMLTHRALLTNIEQVAAVEPQMIHGDDVVLGALPLFHVYGLNAVLGSVLRHRARLLLIETWDPRAVLDLIEDEACSVLPLAPPVFAHWLSQEDLSEHLGPVRLVLSGSASLAAEVVEQFEAVTGIPVHQGYGLTEAAPVVTSTLVPGAAGEDLQRGSLGCPLEGIELRLVDEEGRAVEGGDLGQVEVRGANLFSGYWPDAADGPREDGWWSTGDVGIIGPAGDLVLVDRVAEVVVVSGFSVYPTEVEEVVREVAEVLDAAVIGVPDESAGEAVVAYVVAREGAVEVEERVAAHVEEHLARFKQPSRIEVVDRLPLTVTGRVQKGRLRGLERRRALGLLE